MIQYFRVSVPPLAAGTSCCPHPTTTMAWFVYSQPLIVPSAICSLMHSGVTLSELLRAAFASEYGCPSEGKLSESIANRVPLRRTNVFGGRASDRSSSDTAELHPSAGYHFASNSLAFGLGSC